MLTKFNSRGDTIIEVMISLAVLGLVIGLAYGTSNKSLQGIRNAQEREEALKLAQGAIETIAKTSGTPNYLGCNLVAGSTCLEINGTRYDMAINNNSAIVPAGKPAATVNNIKVTWEGANGINQTLDLYYVK